MNTINVTVGRAHNRPVKTDTTETPTMAAATHTPLAITSLTMVIARAPDPIHTLLAVTNRTSGIARAPNPPAVIKALLAATKPNPWVTLGSFQVDQMAGRTQTITIRHGHPQDKKTGDEVKYSTLLETMTLEEKYLFIKEHGHPFARVVGLPYFNPYGIVPLNDALTAIIPKTSGRLYVSSGQRLDYPEYVEGRGVMRAAVVANIPKKATIEEGKFLTWGHFGPSVRISVYNYVYASKPYFYHFRDKTGENNWLIDAEATEYLLEVGSYYKKTGNGMDPMEFLRGYQTRNLKKNNAKKLYIEEPNSENPYYYPILGTDKNYAGKASTSQASSKYIAPPPSSSAKARDARHADKVVAKEEARAKAEASMAKPRDLLSNAGGTANEKLKPRPKPRPQPKRRIESDDESSDDESSKLVSRPAPSSPIPTNYKGRSDRKPTGGTEPRKKSNEVPQKSSVRVIAGTQDRNNDEPDEETTETKSREGLNKAPALRRKSKPVPPSGGSDLEEDESDDIRSRVTIKRNQTEEEPKQKPEKSKLSVRERARRKMRPLRQPTPTLEENEVPYGQSNKAEIEVNGQVPRTVSNSEEELVGGEDEEEGVDEEQRGGKRANPTPTRLSPGPDDPSSIASQPLVDGMRVIKATRMMVKIPNSEPVASRTRHKTK
ncbi:unnamed protein product [Rhizoctonia solani]|uniref:Uncharacterized protein n=1 Tax=Rhizoctonia solani TaxID=456999 RepID=A0A8H3GIP9_9AGAM|nr:unnamed protein product [Rhizoctonia solani]